MLPREYRSILSIWYGMEFRLSIRAMTPDICHVVDKIAFRSRNSPDLPSTDLMRITQEVTRFRKKVETLIPNFLIIIPNFLINTFNSIVLEP